MQQKTYQIQKVTASNAAAFDSFGFGVGLSGTYAISGAYRKDVSALSDAGSAYIYERQTDGTWLEAAVLTAPDASAQSDLGFSVAISGTYAIAGARRNDHSALNDAGAAYIWQRGLGGLWNFAQKLTATPAVAGAQFGNAVAIDGDRAVVAARFESNAGGASAGAIYVFEKDLNGIWIQTDRLLASDAAIGDTLGQSVAIHGDRVIAGAYVKNAPGANSAGAAYIWEKQPGGGWVEHKLLAADFAASDQFGYSVDIEGEIAVIGAPASDPGGITGAGSAYVFMRDNVLGTWVQASKLVASDAATSDDNGFAVAIANSVVFTGAHFDDNGAIGNAGSLYVWDTNGTQLDKVTDVEGLAQDGWAARIAADGDRVFVGAETDDLPGISNCGSATIVRWAPGSSISYGTGTPGCSGTHNLSVSTVPEIGMSSFALRGGSAEPNTLGLGLITDSPDFTGTDTFSIGILLHVSIFTATEIYGVDRAVDGLGNTTTNIPIPSAPALVGKTYFCCDVFGWTTCTPSPFNLSSSKGLGFTILGL